MTGGIGDGALTERREDRAVFCRDGKDLKLRRPAATVQPPQDVGGILLPAEALERGERELLLRER